MNAPEPRFFTSTDGTRLAWREMGQGFPVVLIHGLFSSSVINWIKYGAAAEIAGRGFRVIMPDLRAHGDSDKPHDAASYPADILMDDAFALIDHLALAPGDYDLGGYSLGGRTVVRMLANGARPRRAVIAGMGLEGLLATGTRAAHFRHVLRHIDDHPRGSPEWMAAQFLKTTGGDPQALLPLLDSFVDTPEEALHGIQTPTLIVAGEDDDDNGSAGDLAALLPDARCQAVPGNHMSAVTMPELGRTIADFLSA